MWVGVLLVLMVYIFAIMAQNFFKDTMPKQFGGPSAWVLVSYHAASACRDGAKQYVCFVPDPHSGCALDASTPHLITAGCRFLGINDCVGNQHSPSMAVLHLLCGLGLVRPLELAHWSLH